jgi:serine protease
MKSRFPGSALAPCLTSLLALGLTSSAVARDPQFAAPQEGPVLSASVRTKPVHTTLESFHRRDVVRVKFKDDLAIRLRGGELSDLGTHSLDTARATLALLSGGEWRRAHTLGENDLERLRANASRNLGRATSDLNLQFDLVLPASVTAEQAIDALNALDCVELADPAPMPPPAPTVPDFQPNQTYLLSAPNGINATNAWSFAGGTGAGVRVCDIEYSYNASHADLPPVTVVGATVVDPFNSTQHGTAVIGEIAAVPNGFGVTGIANGVTMFFSAANTVNGYHVDAAVVAAIQNLAPGDVILLEQQAYGPNNVLLPVEWDVTVYNAIQTAIGNGIVVVEAAANGGQDLDAPALNTGHNGHLPFLPQNDSGAILVGAGASPVGVSVDRSRLAFSNYGSTVDLQGWGELVYTAGLGTAYSADGVNQYYASNFNGTSSASPMITSACAMLEAAHKAKTGTVLTPAEVRAALIATGNAQQAGQFPSSQHIGPRPDIAAAIQALGDGIASVFCTGDGSGTACPCGNASGIGSARGCVNSLGTGAALVASGNASLANDTLQLLGTGMPSSSAIYFQGDAQRSAGAGSMFGDGLRCAGGFLVRLGPVVNGANGASSYPVNTAVPIATLGHVRNPGVRYYQVWYQDTASFCMPRAFNFTNGVRVTWVP